MPGVSGVMFPFTSTPELARAGRRGLPLSAGRAARFGPGAGAHHLARGRGELSRFGGRAT